MWRVFQWNVIFLGLSSKCVSGDDKLGSLSQVNWDFLLWCHFYFWKYHSIVYTQYQLCIFAKSSRELILNFKRPYLAGLSHWTIVVTLFSLWQQFNTSDSYCLHTNSDHILKFPSVFFFVDKCFIIRPFVDLWSRFLAKVNGELEFPTVGVEFVVFTIVLAFMTVFDCIDGWITA